VNSTTSATPPERGQHRDPWADDTDEAGNAPIKRLTHEQAQALLANSSHAVSPWRVIAVQAAIGGLAAMLAGLASAQWNVFWSALYGAAVVVVPGALMARGMTRKQSSVSPGASAVSVMLWSMVKIAVSIVMLMLATRLVQPLSWPALLVSMVLCMLVYWFALLKRSR
jgi:ATP synthase protein I